MGTELKDAFDRIRRRADEAVRLSSEAVHEVYLDEQAAWFESEGGGTWPRNTAATLRAKRRRGQGSQTFIATGRLKESLTDERSPDHVWRTTSTGWEMGTRRAAARWLKGDLLVPIDDRIRKAMAAAAAAAIQKGKSRGEG